MGRVPKIAEESSERIKRNRFKRPKEHFEFNFTLDELVGVWKSLRACKLSEVMRIGEDKATFRESISNVVSAEILTLLLIARAMLP